MGKNWAIAVGINKYDNLQPLNYAKRDAEAMATWFKEEAKFDEVFLFTEDSPTIKTNPPILTQPYSARFRRFLNVQFERPLLKPEDNLWFFFAGHGRRYADRDYLMFWDSDPTDKTTAIAVDFVTQRLRRSEAGNVVLLLDACRDEGSRGGLGIGEEEHQGVITFYSCTANQQSWEIAQLQHGSFTYTLLEGLRLQGEANNATVERLDQYLCRYVPQINARYQKPVQNPYLKAEPPYKMHLILLEQSATLRDVEPLKLQASLAENRGNLSLAEQLWIRVLAVSRADWDAIDAIKRIDRLQGQLPPPRNELPTWLRSSSETELHKFQFEVITVDAKGQEVKREKGQAEYFTEDLGNDITLDLVYIPGGKFLMGTEDEEIERLWKKYNKNYFRREKPQHEVKVQPFFMGKYPITQAQWSAIASREDLEVKRDLKPDPSRFNGNNLPVERVSWYDAVEFCQRLSKLTRQEYRLSSEAEWEYACRAGTATPFHFGETITSELANYNSNYTYASEPKGKYREQTTPVNSFPPNAFGLYDMHGNVWEWCADNWHDNYEDAPIDRSARTKGINDNRSPVRGGSWDYDPDDCRSASRGSYIRERDGTDDNVGFRVVCGVGRTLLSVMNM